MHNAQSHRQVEGDSETVRVCSHTVMSSNEEATLKSFFKTPTAGIVRYKTRDRNTDYVFHTCLLYTSDAADE